MKASLPLRFYAVFLAPYSTLVHSFPTAENFAKIARHGGLDLSNVSPHELQGNLLRLKEKRLLFDPLTTSIDGG
jgi:hypothetical protein